MGERDLLTLSLFLLLVLMPKLKQTPGTDTTDTVLVTMAMAMGTMAIPTCMARGLLMSRLNLLPKLKLTPIFFMATMDLDIIMGAIMATRTMAMATVTTMASKKGRDPIRADKDEVPRFLTTTCLIFSTSEKSKCSKQNFFKLAAFKHLYILSCGIFAVVYLLSPLKPQERTRNVWF